MSAEPIEGPQRHSTAVAMADPRPISQRVRESSNNVQGGYVSTITKDHLDAALDAALAMTFPASDPVALFIPVAEPLLLAESVLNSARARLPLADR